MPCNDKLNFPLQELKEHINSYSKIENGLKILSGDFRNTLKEIISNDNKNFNNALIFTCDKTLKNIILFLDISKLEFEFDAGEIYFKLLEEHYNKNNEALYYQYKKQSSLFPLINLDFTYQIIDKNMVQSNFLNEFFNEIKKQANYAFNITKGALNNVCLKLSYLNNNFVLFKNRRIKFTKKNYEVLLKSSKIFEETLSKCDNFYSFTTEGIINRVANEFKEIIRLRFNSDFNVTTNFFKNYEESEVYFKTEKE